KHDGYGTSVIGNRIGVHGTQVTHAAASVFFRIAIQAFDPGALFRYADAIIRSRYGRKIEYEHQLPGVVASNVTDCGILPVAEVDPFETLWIVIPQCRMFTVQ